MGEVNHLYDMFPVRLCNVQTFESRVMADWGSHSTSLPYKVTKETHKCHFPHTACSAGVCEIHSMIYNACVTAERWPYHEMGAHFKLQAWFYSHGQRFALISLPLSLTVSVPLVSVSSPQWGWLNRP